MSHYTYATQAFFALMIEKLNNFYETYTFNDIVSLALNFYETHL